MLTLGHEVQQFIDDQVKTGSFPTPAAVVQVASTKFSDAARGFQITPADVIAMNKAKEQADHGEGIELDEFTFSVCFTTTRLYGCNAPFTERRHRRTTLR